MGEAKKMFDPPCSYLQSPSSLHTVFSISDSPSWCTGPVFYGPCEPSNPKDYQPYVPLVSGSSREMTSLLLDVKQMFFCSLIEKLEVRYIRAEY